METNKTQNTNHKNKQPKIKKEHDQKKSATLKQEEKTKQTRQRKYPKPSVPRNASPMKSLKEVQEYLEDLAETFRQLSAEDKLHLLIELGKDAPEFPKQFELPENRVPGCISDAYFIVSEQEGTLFFQGVAKAAISQGFVAILLNCCNGLSKEDFEHIDPLFESFLQQSQVNASMVPSRANAFSNMFTFMKTIAKKIVKQ